MNHPSLRSSLQAFVVATLITAFGTPAPVLAAVFVLRVDGRTAGSGNYFVHVELLVSDALSPLCDLRVRGRFE